MSGVVDLPMVILQKAQHAAEAAAASAKLLETEAGLRLTSIEARMVGVEGRLSALFAGQGSHTVAIMRIADTQSEHTAALMQLAETQSEHTAVLMRLADTQSEHTAALITQSEHTARLAAMEGRLEGIEQLLSAILAKLP